jgi:hypothetical protein
MARIITDEDGFVDEVQLFGLYAPNLFLSVLIASITVTLFL